MVGPGTEAPGLGFLLFPNRDMAIVPAFPCRSQEPYFVEGLPRTTVCKATETYIEL